MGTPIGIVLEICLQKIGEKENFQNEEHHKKLDQHYQPGLPGPGRKIGKPIAVKTEDLFDQAHECSGRI